MRTVLISLLVVAVLAPSAAVAQTRGPTRPRAAETPASASPPRVPMRAPASVRDSLERMGRGAASPRRIRGLPMGTFMATRIDQDSLPLQDRVVDDDGTLYLIEFDRMVISLTSDQSFRASVRYRRTLFAAAPRGRGRGTPLQSMTVTGKYELVNGEIRFTPDASNEAKGLRMMAGRVRSSNELSIPFQYRNGTQQRDRMLTLTRRDDIL